MAFRWSTIMRNLGFIIHSDMFLVQMVVVMAVVIKINKIRKIRAAEVSGVEAALKF